MEELTKEQPQTQQGLKQCPDDSICDFLPPEIIKMLKKSPYTFSQSEQILLTLLTQIIVEIIIKEEI